jgi:hypothetical protein
MREHLRALSADDGLHQCVAEHGLATIRRSHTCAHRVDELIGILEQVRGPATQEVVSA